MNEIGLLGIFIGIVLAFFYIKMKNTREIANKNEKNVRELKEDARMFCNGRSMEQVKVTAVVYELLNVLDYELKGKEVKLLKKKK